MEDYEQKYKQALDAFRKFRDTYKTTVHSVTYKEMKKLFANVEASFPELRESEDEKIRKSLIGYLKECLNNTRSEVMIGEYGDWIAWLEKQGKQKPAWSEEDEQMLGKCIDATSGYYSPEDKQSMKDWLRDIKDRVQPQPKQEWSEEDEKMRKRAICACNFTIDRTMGEGHYQEARDWLKSLPIGFIKNPNYNEDMVELLVIELRQIENQNKAPKQYDKEIEWLKSLRPQNTWKPSDEQIEMLENVRKILYTNKDIYSKANHFMYNFEELIRTLKKLKEE